VSAVAPKAAADPRPDRDGPDRPSATISRILCAAAGTCGDPQLSEWLHWLAGGDPPADPDHVIDADPARATAGGPS
jgi:hypothetical protein